MENIGKEGISTVKDGQAIQDEIEITAGMQFDLGKSSLKAVYPPE